MEILKATTWQRPNADQVPKVRETVREIIARIEAEGETAVLEYSRQFDGFEPEVEQLLPWDQYPLEADVREHLRIASERIQTFCEMQKSMYQDMETRDRFGRYGQRVIPLGSMAAYIPGGRFPLISTALMTLIPARIAGVAERIAVSPSNHPGIRAAASLAGATGFLRIGGAQAIAALALGTSFQPAVDMIVGPGNAFVNEAKALVQDRVKIDSLAGPSEILILCDKTADPRWLALDILAQAEHDPMALSVLAANDVDLLKAVGRQIKEEARRYEGKDQGVIQLVHCADEAEMVALSNRMAPEHLAVVCGSGTLALDDLKNYGSLFIGPYSAVALGDYCTGPNHTLPTLGHGRQKGGLQVGDFMKIVTFQEIEEANYEELARTAICLAEVEDLVFHRDSLAVRLPQSKSD